MINQLVFESFNDELFELNRVEQKILSGTISQDNAKKAYMAKSARSRLLGKHNTNPHNYTFMSNNEKRNRLSLDKAVEKAKKREGVNSYNFRGSVDHHAGRGRNYTYSPHQDKPLSERLSRQRNILRNRNNLM